MTPTKQKKKGALLRDSQSPADRPETVRRPKLLERFQSWRQKRARSRTRRRKAQLTVANLLQRIDGARLGRLRQKAAASEQDQAYFWKKYLDVDKWLALNIRYARELGLIEQPPRRVLDLGCGGGYFLTVCRSLGSRVLGLDLDSDAILNELIAIFGLKRMTWQIQPFVKLPVFRTKFDLISAWMICFNLPLDGPAWGPLEWDFLFADLRSYLNPGGHIVLGLNKQLDDGLLYSDELKAYFEALGASIDGKRVILTYDGLRETGRISADVSQKKPKTKRLFKAVRLPAETELLAAGNQPVLPLDRVVVFDFQKREPLRAAAEASALFFLAAWRQNVRQPLEAVCLGEVPDPIAYLAEKCRARISLRSTDTSATSASLPMASAWKAAPGEAGRMLLLSSDVLAFGDPTPELAAFPANVLAVTPIDRGRVPRSCWEQICRALGLLVFGESLPSLRTELGLPVADGVAETLPYYKSEVLFLPRDCPLPGRWLEHFSRLPAIIAGLENVRETARAALLTQVERLALTTAVQAVLAESASAGAPLDCRRLPRSCDGRLAYFEAAADLAYPRLLHVPGLFKRLDNPERIPESLETYTDRWRDIIAKGASQRGFAPRTARLYAAWSNRRLENLLRRLYRTDVRVALRACGVGS